MKTSVSINMIETTTGKKNQRSLTDINPNATSQEIKTFTTGLVALTTQTYSSTDRVQVINVDSEEIPGEGKATPNPQVEFENIGSSDWKVKIHSDAPTLLLRKSLTPSYAPIINGEVEEDYFSVEIYGIDSGESILILYNETENNYSAFIPYNYDGSTWNRGVI